MNWQPCLKVPVIFFNQNSKRSFLILLWCFSCEKLDYKYTISCAKWSGAIICHLQVVSHGTIACISFRTHKTPTHTFPLPSIHRFLQPLSSYYHIDPWTNIIITPFPCKNIQHLRNDCLDQMYISVSQDGLIGGPLICSKICTRIICETQNLAN